MPVLTCQYCGQATRLVGGDAIYPHRPDLAQRRFYQCAPCDAYVGCHGASSKPLGTVANYRLRQLRQQVHAHFDSLWKQGGMSRSAAYNWLRHRMGLEARECHTALFNEKQCKEALRLITNRRESTKQCTAREYLAISKGA